MTAVITRDTDVGSTRERTRYESWFFDLPGIGAELVPAASQQGNKKIRDLFAHILYEVSRNVNRVLCGRSL